ncbi:MAG: hypothetical protein ACJ8R9_16810 [Steroidobacteraceae bacterium]
MPSNLPVARSAGARGLFLLTAIGTLAILFGSNFLGTSVHQYGLSTIYFVLFTRMDYLGAICSLLILICAVLVPQRVAFRHVLRWIGERPYIVATSSALVFGAGALLVYQNHPLAMDEYTQYFQSQVFASGHLAGLFPAPLLNWLIPEGFQNYFLFVSKQTGAVASGYWPAFALLLAPFTFLGIAWAANPLISAATLIVIHRLARHMFDDREAAGLAVLLTIASPVFFANAISFYSMPAHLLANSLFALLLVRPTPRRCFAAGLVGSVALTLHNPVPHILFAMPWLLWLGTRPERFRLLGSTAAGYAPLCLVLGFGWFWFISELRQTNLGAAAAAGAQLEHVQRLGNAFAFPDTTIFIARLIGAAKIWLWAVPGLIVIASSGAWVRRDDVFCRLMLYSALCTFIGFMFVPVDQGHGWGFRYFHTAWVALPLLAAGALARTSSDTQSPRIFASDDARAFVVACALLTLVFGVGFRAWQMYDFIGTNLAQMPAYKGTEQRVIIVDPNFSFYGADLVQNDPWLRGAVIRMITRGSAEDEAMMREHFPNLHRVYADKFGTVWSAKPTPVAGSTP